MQKRLVPKRRFEGFNDDWGKVKVSEIGNDFYGGGTPKTSEESYWNGDIPWIQSSDIDEKLFLENHPRNKITHDGIQNSATRLVPANSIAIVTRVGVGKLSLIPYAFTTSQDFFSISKLNVSPSFGVYALYKLLEKEKQIVQGTSIKGITKEDLLNKEVLISNSCNEQQKIGQLFTHLDEMITLQQRKVDKTKALKSAYLAEMFPAEGESVPKRRFAGFKGEWVQKEIRDIVTDISDGDWIEKEHIFDEGKYRIIQTGNLGIGRYLDKEKSAKYFHQKDFNQLKANEIFPGDILISRLAEPAGRTIILPNTGFRMVTSVDVTIIRPDKKFDSTFFMTLMNSEKVIKKINLEVTGTTHKRISRRNLERIQLMVPKVSEQKQIGKFFKKIDDTIINQQQKLDKLKATKQAYLHEMFL